jgi:hypothetical protein
MRCGSCSGIVSGAAVCGGRQRTTSMGGGQQNCFWTTRCRILSIRREALANIYITNRGSGCSAQQHRIGSLLSELEGEAKMKQRMFGSA